MSNEAGFYPRVKSISWDLAQSHQYEVAYAHLAYGYPNPNYVEDTIFLGYGDDVTYLDDEGQPSDLAIWETIRRLGVLQRGLKRTYPHLATSSRPEEREHPLVEKWGALIGNNLKRNGYDSLDQVAAASDEALLGLQGFGKGMLAKVRAG